jgi:endonuclease-3
VTRSASAKAKFLRAEQIYRRLELAYPDARCALDFTNPLQLLIATILSAQSTDRTVNTVTPALFKRYRTAKDFAGAEIAEIEQLVHSTGFFRNKARSVQGACRMIEERFGGQVPETMEELLELPGVARKTANVVLGVAFGKAEGVVVDTHVQRLSRRLDFSHESQPARIEEDLMRLFRRDQWIALGHLLIHHGRARCQALRPKCAECPVEDLCTSEDKVLSGAPKKPARKKRA